MKSPDAMKVTGEASHYKILRWLGEGLTSVVCMAERQDSRGWSKQVVALKILKSETRIQWLRREFEVLRAIDSPHCVRVLGWENLPGHGPTLVMEAIDGATLAELARRRPFSAAEAGEAARPIQAGLLALREAGLFHGDVSPKNALVDRRGRIRLIDFGLPPPGEGCAATPAYAAPETWEGAFAGWRSDLFSLALLRSDLPDGMRVADALAGAAEARVRARAAASARAAHPWLDPDPANRRETEIAPDLQASSSLADRVCEALDERARFDAGQTRAIQGFAPEIGSFPSAARFAGSAAAALAAIFVLFRPATVASGTAARPAPSALAKIEVRSAQWKEIWLNGARVGFAPARISGVEPGPHRLAWRTRNSSGEARFELAPGQTLRISDPSGRSPAAGLLTSGSQR